MKKENTVKRHATHGFSQFTLTQNLLNNLQQFEITPTAKLVLLYLSSCYNPKKADMFPKQKTIAAKIGVSERSVVRAVSELIQAGLIVVECKYSNRYKFTSKIVSEQPQIEKFFEQENMSDDQGQNFINKVTDCQNINIEPKSEQIINLQDEKYLIQYAKQKGVKKIHPYINAIKRNGNAEGIIKEYKKIERKASFMEKETKRVIADAQFAKENRAENVSLDFFESVRQNCLSRG